MPSNSTGSLSDSILRTIELERRTFWQANSMKSEDERRVGWDRQRVDLALLLMGDSTAARYESRGSKDLPTMRLAASAEQARHAYTTPDIQQPLRPARNKIASVGMDRRSISLDPRCNTTSTTRHDPSKRTHQQMEKSYSAPSAYTSSSSFDSAIPPPSNHCAVYNPAEFVEKLARSDDSYINVKRQKVEGRNGSSHCPSRHTAYPYNVSLSANTSSDLSPPALIASDGAMSRQSSMMSTSSLADGVGMMRFDSSFSNCSGSMQVSFGDVDASFLSYATEKPSNDVTGLYQGAAPQWWADMGNEYPQEISFPELYSSGGMLDGHGSQQESAWLDCSSSTMQRSMSAQSSTSTSLAGTKADERRRKHFENGSRPIASKCLPNGPLSITAAKMDNKIRVLRPQEPGTQRKEPITKAPYVRPSHPKLMCELCSDYPDGFRGDHELRRHHERAHAYSRRVWICVDPEKATAEGWRPSRPLDICKQCNQQKEYNVYYNAAAHLRRAHFCPRKRGRKAKGEERESRAGKAGGDWPPIDWLKNNGWLKEIEVNAADVPASLELRHHDTTASELEHNDDMIDDTIEYACGADLIDYTNLDANVGYNQDIYHDSISADMLCLSYPPNTTDIHLGLPTPALEAVMPWYGNSYSLPQAPSMGRAVSAPGDVNGSMMYIDNSIGFCAS